MNTTKSATTLAEILEPVAGWVERGNRRLADVARRESGTPLGSILEFAIEANGKRVRPALVFLSSGLFGEIGDDAVDLAAAAECLHSATLIHDDIVDGSDSRRGRKSVHLNWSEGAAVLAGDYLFAAAADLVARLGRPRIVSLFAETIMRMSRSEFDAPSIESDPDRMMGAYVAKIEAKTASLFGLCCEAAAELAGRPPEDQKALREYGLNLGNAFQVADDILDVTGDAGVTGKPVGSDLQQGLLTSPTIHFLRSNIGRESSVARFFENGAPDGAVLDLALAELDESGAVLSAQADADRFGRYARQRLANLPDGACARALEGLTHYVASRAS